MKRLLAALALAVALLLPGAARSSDAIGFTRTVYVVNESSVVTDAELADALPAFQASVSQDLARYWNVDARLVLTDAPPKGTWTLTLEDASDILGALGYHDATGHSHVPFARVFAATSITEEVPWQLVFSHELDELLVDPHVDRGALDRRTFRLVEVADPVEDPANSYTRPGASGAPVPLSDFVTARWYRHGLGGPYDLLGRVQRPLQLTAGGYVAWWDGGSWSITVRGQHAPTRRRPTIFVPNP